MIRRLARRPFVRNVAILSFGQTVAQGLAIAASPLLTRLYSPDDFGLFGLLVALAGMMVVVSGLRYELAVVTAPDDQSAADLLVLSCGIVVIVAGFTALIVGFGGGSIADLVDRPGLGDFLWWLPLLVLLGGTAQAFGYWTTRRKHFKRFALSKVTRTLTSVAVQLTAGLSAAGAAGLIGGRAAGSFLAGTILASRIWQDDRALVLSAIKGSRLVKAAKENARFPRYNAPHSLISSLSQVSVPYTLAAFFGVEIAGLYYLAERVMRTPSVLVAGSVRRVFYQRASELYNQGKSFRKLLVSTQSGLFLIGIAPLTVLVLFGPELFSFVFGADWNKAGVLAQWLVGWWFLSFMSGPALESLIILKLQKYLLYYQISIATARILAILVGASLGDEILAVAACALAGAVMNFGLITCALVIVHRRSNPGTAN